MATQSQKATEYSANLQTQTAAINDLIKKVASLTAERDELMKKLEKQTNSKQESATFWAKTRELEAKLGEANAALARKFQ